MDARSLRMTVACALLGVGMPAFGAGTVRIEMGELEFGGLAVAGLELDVARSGAAAGSVRIRAARIRGLAATCPLSQFSLDCPDLSIDGNELRCRRGRLGGGLGALGAQDTHFDATRRPDGSLRLAFDDFAVAGGRGRLDVETQGAGWVASAKLAGLDIAELAAVARPFFAMPEGFSVAGRTAGEFRASGSGDLLRTAGANLAVETFNFSDAEGALAGEKLAGTVVVDATADASSRMPAHGRISLAAGQAYADPVFLDFAAHRADLDFDGMLDTDTGRFEASSFAIDHAGVLKAGGSATLDFAGETLLVAGQVRIDALDFSAALPAYVQPFLVGTSFKDITGSGSLSGDVTIAGGLPARAALDFDDVGFDSPTSAVSLEGLDGHVAWFDDEARTTLAGKIDDALFQSRMSWKSGRLWGLELGATSVPFAATGRHFRLLEPVVLPVFDGGLAIDTLRIRNAGTDDMYVRFDAELRPISVALLSRAFGWPEFQGTLEGSIPGLQLRQGVVTLDGALDARVFDGRIAVRDLRLQDPLGKFPRLFANIGVENLDLELVTRTFEFGTITGRLSGYVSELETFGWLPEAFDAALFTPPDDRSRRRISQRAVTNLSSIGGGSGGGVAAALQGGFLRFFDTFRYDRLGLTCRLANDVCLMGGVLPAPTGYYIVKGAGLPRINVIGSQSRVAWTTLVRQLGAMTESEIVVQ